MKKLWLRLLVAVLLPMLLLCACAKREAASHDASPATAGSSSAAAPAGSSGSKTEGSSPAPTGGSSSGPATPSSETSSGNLTPNGASLPADGTYHIAVTLTGGTGKATILSPASLKIQNGQMTATVVWSSANYDYMLVDGVRYEVEIVDGHSTFGIPVAALDTELPVVGDTVAMSTPHEISYTLRFDSATLEAVTP